MDAGKVWALDDEHLSSAFAYEGMGEMRHGGLWGCFRVNGVARKVRGEQVVEGIVARLSTMPCCFVLQPQQPYICKNDFFVARREGGGVVVPPL